jgi:hypothetical protein
MRDIIVQKCELLPFESGNFTIKAAFCLKNGILELAYLLTPCSLPTVEPETPTRKWELWEKTCLEFFCGHKGQEGYFEFNFSLEYEWNLFHLDRYREGIKEHQAVDDLAMQYRQIDETAELIVRVPWKVGFDEYQFSAVVLNSSKKEYYALAHGKDADFHNRSLFRSL